MIDNNDKTMNMNYTNVRTTLNDLGKHIKDDYY